MRLITWAQVIGLMDVNSQAEFDEIDFILRKMPLMRIASKLCLSEQEAKELRWNWQFERTKSPYSQHGKMRAAAKSKQ